jgi:hypothetical protein
MTRLEEIQAIIDKYDLTKKCRLRQYTYQRYYLYALLRSQGMPLTEIGVMFNRTHATVIHGIANHDVWYKQKDELYLYYTLELRKLFASPRYYKPLRVKVLECNDMEKLDRIKEQIRCNYY